MISLVPTVGGALRRGAAVSAAVAAAACTTPDLDRYWSSDACREDAIQYVEGIDWARARIVSIRIRQGEYDPLIIRLLQDQPYVFRIINRDDDFRDFSAVEFFDAVAVDNVSINGVDTGESCISTVTVPPMQTAELRLVAVRDGRYEFEDQPLPLPGLVSWGGSGVISINMKSSIPIARYSDLVPSRPGLAAPPGLAPTPVESEEEETEDEEDGEDAGPPGTKSIFADEDEEEEGEPKPPTTKSIFDREDDEEEEEDEDGEASGTTKSIFSEDEDEEDGSEDDAAEDEVEDADKPRKKAKKSRKKPRGLFAEEDEEELEDEDEEAEDEEAAPDSSDEETKTALDSDRDADAPGSLQEILKDEPSPDDATTKSLQEILRETEVPSTPESPDDAETSTPDDAPDAEAAPDETTPETEPAPEVKTVREGGETSTETPSDKVSDADPPTAPAGRPAPGTSLFDSVFGRVLDSFGNIVPPPRDGDR